MGLLPERSKYRRNNMSLYVGIDVGKFYHLACFLDDRGNQLDELKFTNTYQGFSELEKIIQKHAISEDRQTLLGMEATGHYWFPLYEFLRNKGYRVKVFNPLKVNRFRDFYIQPVKTDPKDAFVIANILRYGKVKPTSLAPAEVQRLQRLVRYRRYLCDRLSQVKNKIRCLLDEVFPEYQSLRISSCLFGQASRALLKIAPTPEKILSLPIEEWAIYLEAHSRKLGWKRAYEKAHLLYNYAKLSVGSKTVAKPLAECIKDLIYELEDLTDRIRFFTKEVEDALSSTPGAILTTIPGVGAVTAATITSGIGDIGQFKSANQLVCYCGLIPTSHSSGTFTSTRNRMAKRGQTSLAHVFYQIALTSLRCNPVLREYYLKKLSEGKPRKVAVVAVARKLVRIVYSMLKSNRAYDDAFNSKSS